MNIKLEHVFLFLLFVLFLKMIRDKCCCRRQVEGLPEIEIVGTLLEMVGAGSTETAGGEIVGGRLAGSGAATQRAAFVFRPASEIVGDAAEDGSLTARETGALGPAGQVSAARGAVGGAARGGGL